MTVREYIEQLRAAGLGLYQAMDELDRAAARDGFVGGAFYAILCDVYSDWVYPTKPNHRYVKPDHTLAEWLLKKEQYGHKCFYCGRKRKLTKDHIIPISQGGSDKIDNIVPACWFCNYHKRAREVTEFKDGVMFKLL